MIDKVVIKPGFTISGWSLWDARSRWDESTRRWSRSSIWAHAFGNFSLNFSLWSRTRSDSLGSLEGEQLRERARWRAWCRCGGGGGMWSYESSSWLESEMCV